MAKLSSYQVVTVAGSSDYIPLVASGHPTRVNRVITKANLIGAPITVMPSSLPNSISNLVLWLKADAGAYTDAGTTLATNGQTVQQWNDQSGGGHNATQATSGNRATFTTNVVNSLPALRFDNSNDGYTFSSSITISNPFTMFVVMANGATSGNHRLLQGASNNWLIGPYTGWWAIYSGAFTNCVPVATPFQTEGCILTVTQVDTPTSLRSVYFCGSLMNRDTSVTSPGSLTLGNSGAFGEPASADLLEVIVYSRQLPYNELNGVHRYLAARYAIGLLYTSPAS